MNTSAGTVAATRIPNLWGGTTQAVASLTGRYLFRNNADFPVMTYSELQLIKAEAAFIKGDKAMALDAYKKGIGIYNLERKTSLLNKILKIRENVLYK